LDSFREKGFPPGCPWTPSGPSLGPGRLWPLCGGRRRSPLFPFLTWSWFPPSSSDFGTCPENHSASISQGVSFCRCPVGPSASLRWVLSCTGSDRVDDGHCPCRKHRLEMRPIKYVLSGGLLILFSLQLLLLRYRSVVLLQGVPLHKATRRVLTVLWEPVELTPFSGRLSPPATFSVQSLSLNQEAFRVFRPED
jgi:hypothetical protein